MGNLSPDCISKITDANNELSPGRCKGSQKKRFTSFRKLKAKTDQIRDINKRRKSRYASHLFNSVRSKLSPIRSKCIGYKFLNCDKSIDQSREPLTPVFPAMMVNTNAGTEYTRESYPHGITHKKLDTSSCHFSSQKPELSQNIDDSRSDMMEGSQDSSILTEKTIIGQTAPSEISNSEVSLGSYASIDVRKTSDDECFQSLNSSHCLGFVWDSQSASKTVSQISNENSLVSSFGGEVGTTRFLNQFELLGELGRGSFGVVMKVLDRIDKQEYALKIIPLTRKSAEIAMKEPQLHAMLTPHPNVCRYMGVWCEVVTEDIRNVILKNSPCPNGFKTPISYMHDVEEVLIIQMELFDMNLKKYLKDIRTTVHKGTSLIIFENMLAGIAQLHGRTKVIMHRDLKPSNVFLKMSSSGQVIKASIGDFGLSTPIDNGIGNVGTPTYGAPEQKSGSQKYNEKVDVYSLGLILFELFHAPWTTEMERAQDLSYVKMGQISDTIKTKYPRVALLVEKCVSATPSERPTVTEIHEDICNQIAEDYTDSVERQHDVKKDKIGLLREVRILRRLLTHHLVSWQ